MTTTAAEHPLPGVDIAVVGADVTGLTAATELVRSGRSVVVLEARDRVGGRLWTDTVDGVMLELGGQWVSPDQCALLATIDELGLETFSRYRDGESVYIGRDGVRRTFTGPAFPVTAATRAEVGRITAILNDLAQRTDPGRPWDLPNAADLDRISFASWLDAQTEDQEAKDNIGLYVGAAMLTKPTHEFSALSAVLMASSAGSFSNLVDADVILDKRVVGGLQQVPLKLAEALGDRVKTNAAVQAVEWSADGAVVRTPAGNWAASRVVVAVPPTLVQRIRFRPSLPPLQMQWRQHQSFGLVIKLHATYDTPFWRDAGLSGTAFSPYQLVHEAYDNSNHGDGRGTLVGFISDLRADDVLNLEAAERRDLVLQSLAAYYGDQALRPRAYYESQWMAEEWTAGAYGTSFGIGGLTRYRSRINEPVGPISFGTSDIPGPGFQHVDGAIRIGRDLARRAIS